MPSVEVKGVALHYQERGSGPEALVFSHSYLLDSSHFGPQMSALSPHYRCIAFDHRGHGGSERPQSGYDMETLYTDAVAFIRAMNCAPVHFVGLSTGGFIGLRLGFRRPDLLRTLTLMDSSAQAEPAHKRLQYGLMTKVVAVTGMRPFAGYVMSQFFSKRSRREPAKRAELSRFRRMIVDNDAETMVKFGRGILARQSVLEHLPEISVPTLVIVGEQDKPQPPARARRMAEAIPGAELLLVPDAAHISTVDSPDLVNAALVRHFRRSR